MVSLRNIFELLGLFFLLIFIICLILAFSEDIETKEQIWVNEKEMNAIYFQNLLYHPCCYYYENSFCGDSTTFHYTQTDSQCDRSNCFKSELLLLPLAHQANMSIFLSKQNVFPIVWDICRRFANTNDSRERERFLLCGKHVDLCVCVCKNSWVVRNLTIKTRQMISMLTRIPHFMPNMFNASWILMVLLLFLLLLLLHITYIEFSFERNNALSWAYVYSNALGDISSNV